MRILPRSIERVISQLSRLPGIGPKSASRLTFFLYKLTDSEFDTFVQSLSQLKSGVQSCELCYNMSESPRCEVCSDPKRQADLVCVVEDPLDVMAIEQTRKYQGVYHVLNGAISPIDGIGPDQLNIAVLIERVKKLLTEDKQVEVILATNPSLEGDTTALYIGKELKPLGVKITRLARGLPVGGDLEYTDELTLSDALNYRKEIG